jgi:hypothetical protein
MKRFFQQIWDDIAQGENIDLYIAVPIAIILAVLNIIGIVPSQVIEPTTLLVMSLISISLLVNRNTVRKLAKEITQHTDDVFRSEFPPNFESDIYEGKEVWLIGVTLTDFLRKHYFQLQKKLADGHVIHAIIVDPESPALELAERRNARPTDTVQARNEAKASLKQLCQLRDQATKGKLEVRIIQHPLSYAAFGVNLKDPSGILYISHFAFKLAPGSEPKLVLNMRDGRWYDFFKQEVNNIWDDGVEWHFDNSDAKQI